MALKVRRRPDTGALEITGTVRPAGHRVGIRIRQRAGSDDPRRAAEEAVNVEAAILRSAWYGERPSIHTFAEAVTAYLTHEARDARTIALVRRLLLHFREAPLGSIDQAAVDRARDAILRPGAKPATVKRNLLVPLHAILVFAERRGMGTAPKFDAPRIPRARTHLYAPEQAEALIAEGRHLAPLLRFLFCTGCRLGEALALDWKDVDLRGRRLILHEGETKAGTRRVVDLVPAAVTTLGALDGREGAVFRTLRGEPYRVGDTGGGGQIKTAWAATRQRAGVTEGSPHWTRHSWASWHYALHRDLLLLQAAGGWGSVELVARYAHLMPEGSEDAIRRVWGLGVGQAVMGRRA